MDRFNFLGKEIVLESFPYQRRPIAYACNHIPRMDVIEVILGPCPVLGFAVVDFELDILRNPISAEARKVSTV